MTLVLFIEIFNKKKVVVEKKYQFCLNRLFADFLAKPIVDIGKLASSVSPKWPHLTVLNSATLEIPWKLIY